MKTTQVVVAVTVVIAALGGRAAQYSLGDLFVSTSSGTVQWRDPTGQTLKGTLTTGNGQYETGSAFDSGGNFFVTDWSVGTVTLFDNFGAFGNNFVSAGNPESIVFDTSGNFYVSGSKGMTGINKFDASGNLITTFLSGIQVDWIELDPDQCTLYYTQEGRAVKRFNVCTGVPLSDFATLPGDGEAYAIRYLPGGGLLVADSDNVKRLNSSGNVVHTYTLPDAGPQAFSLALATDGTSFWVGDTATADISRIDLASGTVLTTFNSGNGGYGLSVYPYNGFICQPPVITRQPQSLSLCVGDTATFQVTVKGSYPLSFHWQKYVNSQWLNLSDGGHISGSQTATLTISPVGSADGGQYRVVVTNPCGTATSDTATLTVNVAPTQVTVQPQNVSVCPGDTVLFYGTTDGSGGLTYQWSLNGVNLVDGPRISGSQTAVLIIRGVIPADVGFYQLTVANTCGSASGGATLSTSPNYNFDTINIQFSAIEYYGEGGRAAADSLDPNFGYRWNVFYGPSGGDATGTYPLHDGEGTCTPVTLILGQEGQPTYVFTEPPANGAYHGLLRGGLMCPYYCETLEIEMQGIPSGTYDLYLYGTGGTIGPFWSGTETWASNFELYYPSAGVNPNPQATSTSEGWDLNTWVEGNQYVVFRAVQITDGQVYIDVHPYGPSGYEQPLINGLQLVPTH